MRSALFITAAAILLIAYLWLDQPIDSPEQQGQARSTAPTPTPAAPKASRPFQPFSALPPSNDPPPGLSGPYPHDPEPVIPIPVSDTPAVPPVPRMAASTIPVDPRWEEIASSPTFTQAKPIYIGVVGSQSPAGFNQDDTDWQRGTLTLQGSYSYQPLYSPSPTATARITIAATLNCRRAKGILYFRDQDQRVEWLSSEFPFDDAETYCAIEQEQLDELATRFRADIAGSYTPLTTPLIDDDSGTIQQQIGWFNLRLTSGETAYSSQSAVKLCLVLRGGGYADYVLPPNARNASAMSRCAFLHSFTLQRNL